MKHARRIHLAPSEDPRTAAAAGADAEPAHAVEIYTDGACKGNPGPGGWGAWLKSGAHERELFGGEPATTNNRMELTAVIQALAALKQRCTVVLHTDSQYVRNGITEWLPNWVRRGWKTSDNKPVKNDDLWRLLAEQAARHEIDWRWVKGHSGVHGNERADELANRGVELALRGRSNGDSSG